MEKFKKHKGITLISLIITIIILIILAGISISMILGNEGLLNKAKYATESYSNAQQQEELELAKYSNDINSYVSGNRNYETEIKELKDRIAELENINSYSTTERIVGKWVDGTTPIYKKTIQITTPNSTGDYKIIDYSSISSDLDFVIKADGIIIDSSGGTNIPSYYDNGTWCELTWSTSASGIYMRATNTLVYASRTAYINVYYTKIST